MLLVLTTSDVARTWEKITRLRVEVLPRLRAGAVCSTTEIPDRGRV